MANLTPPIPLEDIVLSPAQGFWPLAPGWWILMVLSLIMSSWGIYLWLKKRKQMAFFKRQQKQLDLLEKQLRTEAISPQNFLAALNRLLKLTLVNYTQQKTVAGLSGKALSEWLEKQLNIPEQLRPLFNDSIFQKESQSIKTLGTKELLSILNCYRNYQTHLVNILLKQTEDVAC